MRSARRREREQPTDLIQLDSLRFLG